MAVVYNPEEKNKESLGPDGQPTTITNPGVVGAPSVSSNTPAAGAPTSSGRFSNITGYLNANKNFGHNEGGLAGKIANNLTTTGEQLNKNVTNAVNNFNNQANAQVNNAQTGMGLANQAVADPTKFTQNADNTNSLIQAKDASYNGPKTLGDLSGEQNQAVLESKAKNFNDTVNQGQTENGRFNLLRTMFNKPSYSSGQQNLDNLLIQGNKEQLNKIQGTRALANTVNQNLNTGIQQTQQVGANANQTVENSANKIKELLNNRAATEGLNIQAGFDNAQRVGGQNNSELNNLLQNGILTPDLALKYGISPGSVLGNLNLNDYFTKSNDPTLQNSANKSQYGTVAALNKLLGNSANSENQKLFNDLSNPALAESFNPEGTFNSEAFKSAQQNQMNTYQGELSPWQVRQKEAIDTIDRLNRETAEITKKQSLGASSMYEDAQLVQDKSQLEGESGKLQNALKQQEELKKKYNLDKLIQFLKPTLINSTPVQPNAVEEPSVDLPGYDFGTPRPIRER